MILLKRDKKSGVITLTNDKQKNAEEFGSITLKLRQVSLGTDAAGKSLTSCVVEATNPVTAAAALGICGGVVLALQALVSLPNGEAHSSAWRRAVEAAEGKPLSKKTFDNWRKTLLKGGFVEGVSNGIRVYRATDAGRSASASPVP